MYWGKLYRFHVRRWIIGALILAGCQHGAAYLKTPTARAETPKPKAPALVKRVKRLETRVTKLEVDAAMERRIDARIAERESLR